MNENVKTQRATTIYHSRKIEKKNIFFHRKCNTFAYHFKGVSEHGGGL